MATLAPRRSSAPTMPRPIPPAPPVTTATAPLSSSGGASSAYASATPSSRGRFASLTASVLPLDAVVVEPEAGLADSVRRRPAAEVLVELRRRRPDVSRDRGEGVEVEVVAADGVEAEQEPGLLHRDLPEVGGEPGDGVGPGALGVGVVGAPHEGVDPVGVAAADLGLAHRRRADEDVGAEVLRREPFDRPL